MAVDKSIWKNSYTYFEGFTCPKCQANTLIEDEERRITLEPRYSKDEHSEDWWEPDMITLRFSTVLECPSTKCGELVIVSGVGSVFSYEDHEAYPPEQGYAETLIPTAAVPAPVVFPISPEIPGEVEEQIRQAFSLLWVDTAASLNAIRRCVELILDGAKVPKTSTKNGKRTNLTLHARIEKFSQKNKDHANALMALKWLGNSGSHSKKVISMSDTLDAFSVFEHALSEIFAPDKKEIQKRIKEINKSKGF